jgi:hypothetical protein
MPGIYDSVKRPFMGNLFFGMKGERVKNLQGMLDDMNSFYNFYRGKSLDATGFYGNETKHFVTMFQIFVGLRSTDGMVDSQTHEMLEYRYFNYLDSMTAKMARLGSK